MTLDARLRSTRNQSKDNKSKVINFIEENVNGASNNRADPNRQRQSSQVIEKTPLEKLHQTSITNLMQGYNLLTENFKDHMQKIKKYQETQKKHLQGF